jgi:hypothetical protein
MEDILVPLGFFAMIAAIIIVPRYLKSQERIKLHETLRASIEHGSPLPQDVVDAITSELKGGTSPDRDLRRGIVLLGLAVGLIAVGYGASFEFDGALRSSFGVAAFPGFIGIALIVLSVLARRNK